MTPSKAELEALLERVEKAEGPDREIDALICAELRYHTEANWTPLLDGEWRTDRFGGVGVYPPEGKRLNQPGYSEAVSYGVGSFMAPRLTASIDAAVALVEKAAPWISAWELRSRGNKHRFVADLSHLREGHDHQELCYLGRSDSAPLALCAALLRALIARAEAERIGSPSQEQTASEQNKNLPPEAVE